jgi:ABC-2 type transport system permease protein
MRNLLLLVLNTLKITFRKKGNILIYLFLPLLGVLLSMLIYSGEGSSPLRIGFVDLDKSRLSADFASALSASDGYNITGLGEKDINESLLGGNQDAVLVVPKGFEQGIFGNAPAKVELVSIKGLETTVWLENYTNLYTRNLVDIAAASEGDRAVFDSIYSGYRANPLKVTAVRLEDEKNSKLATVTSMGFLIMFVMLGAGMTSQLILNEKKTRTYYRICSAPVSAKSYIAANAVTSLIIVAFQIIAMQLVIKCVLRLETYVPDLLMFVILMIFGIAAIGISLVVTAFSTSSYMASTLNTLIITPTCMIGGCFWPSEFMSEAIRKIAFFVPQTWALDAIRKLQAGTENIAINLAILLAFAAALFLVAIYKFARTENVQKFV